MKDPACSPYLPGSTINIRRHVPPPPIQRFPDTYNQELEQIRLLREEMQTLSLEERYAKHPPLETNGTGAAAFPLKILGDIRTGISQSAQLVTARRLAAGHDHVLVAKFYDPFFWDPNQDDVDPFRAVDVHYSHEAAAYEKLASLQGTVVPNFYGSYTCEIPMGANRSRSVRLVLMELLKGQSLEQLGSNVKELLPQPARQNIMEKLVRAEAMIYGKGVLHNDIYPRNVVIVNPHDRGLTVPNLRIALIDFDFANIEGEEDAPTFQGPISPILRWHDNNEIDEPFKCRGWIDWDWQPWLEEKFSNDQYFRPVTEDMFHRYVNEGPRTKYDYSLEPAH